jgi:hypothetical protein
MFSILSPFSSANRGLQPNRSDAAGVDLAAWDVPSARKLDALLQTETALRQPPKSVTGPASD